MSWTAEGLEMNGMASRARDIEDVKTKNLKSLAKNILGSTDKESLEMMESIIKKRIDSGWLKELSDRYIMTDRSKKRIEMLRERVRRGVMT